MDKFKNCGNSEGQIIFVKIGDKFESFGNSGGEIKIACWNTPLCCCSSFDPFPLALKISSHSLMVASAAAAFTSAIVMSWHPNAAICLTISWPMPPVPPVIRTFFLASKFLATGGKMWFSKAEGDKNCLLKRWSKRWKMGFKPSNMLGLCSILFLFSVPTCS